MNACCVVQNVAKYYNVPQPEMYYDDLDEEDRNILINDEEENLNGNQIREQIIQLYFT